MQNHLEKSNTPRFHDVISVYKSSRNTQYDKLFPMTLVPTCKRLGGGGGTPTLLRSWGQAAPTAASAPASLMKFFLLLLEGRTFGLLRLLSVCFSV